MQFVYVVIQSSGRPVAAFYGDKEAAIDYALQMMRKGPSAEVVELPLLYGQQLYPIQTKWNAKTVLLK